ncbi:oligosaccharide flippase family protein [Clostridium tyrobutyricum]|uniref:Stage V sporulation protein B n=1 Tax=Clostridium tyrobutyricum DIVETGP TaxID=1408889 RepID=W6N311_CLOTY|nr:polysaccharide biosynthesis protein [Clostridium tyrobutyricum]AND84996.1 SpoVB-like membrane protein [Clostridium tyrobutyricum]ANP69561.1 sporulation protein SpoVB [Clostridium tyrobutyricum]MBV4433088.1 polysaccharide biosynthesis protein [Clostridium tyrobutyricum]MBV4445036.1 polysaccharide biosynthesis protein [Clostridium tyrobutyricum]MBV4449571.1 polysaccharide biosynthesis protein [Clostridium tyrobutyricum]
MKEQSTTKGFAILSAAGMLTKVLSILYVPLLMAIIGDVGYGIYGASYQIYAFVFVLTNSGIPVAISKLISELTATGNYKDAARGFKIARAVLGLVGIFMSVMLIVFALPLARLTDRRAYLSLVSLSPAILFTSVSSSYRGYFQGRGNMTPTAVSQVIEQTLNIIFSIAFAAYLIRYGVEAGTAGSTIGTSIGALASAAFLMFCYNNNRSFRDKNNLNEHKRRFTSKQLLRKIINYGIPITICVGMTYAGNIVDVINTTSRLVVGGFTKDGAMILYGYLNKYQQLMNVPIAIISSLTMAILPAISAAAVVRDENKVKHSINYSFRLCFLISIPCAAGLAILSGPIFNLLKFRGGAYIMACGSIVLVLMSVMQIQTTILQGIGKLYSATIYSVIGIACKIGINYILIAIPRINILGAVGGSIIGYLVPIILNHRMIKKSLSIHISMLGHAVKPVISSIFMGILVFFVYYVLDILIQLIRPGYIANAVSTIIAILIGALSYVFILAIIGGITKRDLNSMPARLTRCIPKFIVSKIR